MRLGPALQEGPNAVQQERRRNESGASSSLQFLACGISGSSQCSAVRTCIASAVLLLCDVGQLMTLSVPMCWKKSARDHLFLEENWQVGT